MLFKYLRKRTSTLEFRIQLNSHLKGRAQYSFLKNFIYFWLCWIFLAACGLSLVAVSGVYSSCGERGLLFVAVHGLLIAVASLVAEHGL